MQQSRLSEQTVVLVHVARLFKYPLVGVEHRHW